MQFDEAKISESGYHRIISFSQITGLTFERFTTCECSLTFSLLFFDVTNGCCERSSCSGEETVLQHILPSPFPPQLLQVEHELWHVRTSPDDITVNIQPDIITRSKNTEIHPLWKKEGETFEEIAVLAFKRNCSCMPVTFAYSTAYEWWIQFSPQLASVPIHILDDLLLLPLPCII